MSVEEAVSADRQRDFANALRLYGESLGHPGAGVEAHLKAPGVNYIAKLMIL